MMKEKKSKTQKGKNEALDDVFRFGPEGAIGVTMMLTRTAQAADTFLDFGTGGYIIHRLY